MKKIIFLVVFIALAFGLYKYWGSIKGIYQSKKPSSEEVSNIIQNTEITPGTPLPGENKTNLPLKFPKEYSLTLYAKDLSNPRDLILDKNGVLLASITSRGRVVAIVNGEVKTVVSDLNKPHGLAFSGDKLYVAETDNVSTFDYDAKAFTAKNKRKILDLPSGGVHFTRSLLIKDQKLYVSTGSSCNACEEKDQRRAAVWFSNLDGTDFKSYSQGLRNAVFMTLDPSGKEIWVTNHGRDNLGDNLPPETINILKEGAHYGWPYCYGNKVTDQETNKNNFKFDCSKMEPPKIEFQAHSAPLGLAFLGKDLLVAYHGSWNRSVPTGYKVVKFVNGKEEDFVTGWRTEKEAWGRPADVLVKDSGKEIFISDDKSGVIYLLSR